MKKFICAFLILIMQFTLVVDTFNDSANAAEMLKMRRDRYRNYDYYNPFKQDKNGENYLTKENGQPPDNQNNNAANDAAQNNDSVLLNKNNNGDKNNNNNKVIKYVNGDYDKAFQDLNNQEALLNKNISDLTKLSVPSGLRTIETSDFVVLVWNETQGVERYELEIDGQAIDCGDKTLYVQQDLKDTSIHKYRVRAVNSYGASEWSSVVTGGLDAGTFDAPQSVISFPTEDSIIICWNNVANATGYEVEVDGAIKDNGLDTNYVDENLKPGTRHSYRVRAKQGSSYTKWSSLVFEETIGNVNPESQNAADKKEDNKQKQQESKSDKSKSTQGQNNNNKAQIEKKQSTVDKNIDKSTAKAKISINKDNAKQTEAKKVSEDKAVKMQTLGNKPVQNKTENKAADKKQAVKKDEASNKDNNAEKKQAAIEKKAKTKAESLSKAQSKLASLEKAKKQQAINTILAKIENSTSLRSAVQGYNVNTEEMQYKAEGYVKVDVLNQPSVHQWEELGTGKYIGGFNHPLELFRISCVKKPTTSTVIKYQAYVYDKNTNTGAWQSVKTEGQSAGENGKTITSLRIWIEGNNHYSVRYNLIYNIHSAAMQETNYVANGANAVNPDVNKTPIISFGFEVYENLPNINVQTYGNYNGKLKWNTAKDSAGFTGTTNVPISKLKLSSDRKSEGFQLKYQVYIKENGAWQEWKNDGQQAGEAGKTITNLRVQIINSSGYFVRYNFQYLDKSNKCYTTNYGSDGCEPIGIDKMSNGLSGLSFEICKGAPILDAYACIQYNYMGVHEGTTWVNYWEKDFLGHSEIPMNKIRIKLRNQPKGTHIKYQLFSKKQNKWLPWNQDDEIAGSDDDTFTSIRMMFDGESLGTGIKYKIMSNENDKPQYISDFGADGHEPAGALANTKPICTIEFHTYNHNDTADISTLNTNISTIVINKRYKVPVGTTFKIPEGKRIVIDHSICKNPGFDVDGTLIFAGSVGKKIAIVNDSAFNLIKVGKTGTLNMNYVDSTSSSSYFEGNLIDNNGILNLSNSSFVSNYKYRTCINTNSLGNTVISGCTIKSWYYGIEISGKGNTTVKQCIIDSNNCGIETTERNDFAKDNKIEITNNTSICNNKIGICVNRIGTQHNYKQLNIIGNVIDNNINGIEFVCNKLANISCVKNVIKNTNKAGEQAAKHSISAPIIIGLIDEDDDNSGFTQFIKDINTTDVNNANNLETGNDIKAIDIEGVIKSPITISKGRYSYISDKIKITTGGKLLIDEGVWLAYNGLLEVDDGGELIFNGSNSASAVISSFDDQRSVVRNSTFLPDRHNGFCIKCGKNGTITGSYAKLYSGGLHSVVIVDGSGKEQCYDYGAIYSEGKVTLSKSLIDNDGRNGFNGILSTVDGTLYLSEVDLRSCKNAIVCGNATLINCTINNSDYGVSAQYGDTVSIDKCNISNNTGRGVYATINTKIYNSTLQNNDVSVDACMDSSKKLTMYQNNIKNSNWGIVIRNTAKIDVQFNNIAGNKKLGLQYDYSPRINVINNYWGHPSGPSAWYYYYDYYGHLQKTYQKCGDAINNNNSDDVNFSPCVSQEIHGINLGLDESKVSEEAYNFLKDYAYNLKKSMVGNSVNAGGGSFAKTYTDLLLKTKGIDINISRSYSSANNDSGILGKGWNFYYTASVVDIKTYNSAFKIDGKVVTLPGGSVCSFQKNSDGTYTALDSRNKLTAANGIFTLTDREGKCYRFNTNGKLYEIQDRKGNKLNFSYNGEYLIKISDESGREYDLTYASGLLRSIQEKFSGQNTRKISYNYNSNNLLESVVDVNGNTQEHFVYDATGKLYQIKKNNTVLNEITYYTDGDNKNKIQSLKDENGLISKYSYNNSNRTTTMTDNLNKVTQMTYDSGLNLTYTIDQDGNYTISNYILNKDNQDVIRELVSQRDKFGYVTQYLRDGSGNITAEVYADYSKIQYFYDKYNNVIKQIDQNGNKTFYIYDANGVNLLKTIVPLNGVDEYTQSSDASKFAITTLEYYDKSTALPIGGLIKKLTRPSGAYITYVYDKYGNIISQTDSLGNVITYTYDKFGDKLTQVNPNGSKISITYDNKGNVLSKTNSLGASYEYLFDNNDRKIAEINPNNEGREDADGNPIFNYVYTYYDNDKVKTKTDSLGNKTEYTYDNYGNKASEKNSVGGTYYYSYDSLGRITKIEYEESNVYSRITLEEDSYTVEEANNQETKVVKTRKLYTDAKNFNTIVEKYNYLNEELEHVNADGSKVLNTYDGKGNITCKIDENGSPTYCYYDANDRLVKIYAPVKLSGSNVKYAVTETKYNIDGVKIQEKVGLDLVDKGGTATNYFVTNYTVNSEGYIISKTDSEGRRTDYSYDKHGNVTCKKDYYTSKDFITTEFVYDQAEHLIMESTSVQKCDLKGNSLTDIAIVKLSTKYTYDLNGNRIKEEYSDGSSLVSKYDDLNRLIRTVRTVLGEGIATKRVIESNQYLGDSDKVTIHFDGEGNKITNTYNNKLDLVSTEYPNGSKMLFTYDFTGKEISKVIQDITSTGVKKVVNDYDACGRVILEKYEVTTSDGKTTTTVYYPVKAYKYDACGNVIKEVLGREYNNAKGTTVTEKIDNALGTEYTYDLDNKAVKVLNPQSKADGKTYTKLYDYDVFGRKIKETDTLGNSINYKLDSTGKVLEETFNGVLNGQKPVTITLKKNTYDLLGNLTSSTDANGNKTEYVMNSFGKVKLEKLPYDSTKGAEVYEYQYDNLGNVAVKTSEATGRVETSKWNSLNKIIMKILSGKNCTETIEESCGYDRLGNITVSKDGNGNTITYKYDFNGNVIEKRVNGKVVYRYTYDLLNNLLCTTDRFGNRIFNYYDLQGRLISKKDAFGVTVEEDTYDLNGNVLTKKDALGNVLTYKYDLDNRLISTTNALGVVTSKKYDTLDRIISETDGKGNVKTYTYDGMGRLIAVKNALGEVTQYGYDLNGNRTSITDAKGNVVIYKYNCDNKTYQIIAPNSGNLTGKVQQYTYNADGSIKNVKDRNGNVISYEYDIFGRKIKESDGSNVLSFGYDKAGNLLKVTNSGDKEGTTTFDYDAENRVTSKTVGVTTPVSLTYTYDVSSEAAGEHKVIVKDSKGGTVTETYDVMNRVKEVNYGTKVIKYTYFSNGSKSATIFVDGSKEVYAYNKDLTLKSLNQLDKTGKVVLSYNYEYDKNKNLVKTVDNKGTTLYTYDALNRLLSVKSYDGSLTEYTYDKTGNRITEKVTKNNKSLDKAYVYDNENRLIKTVDNLSGTTLETIFTNDNNGNLISEVTTDSTLKNVKKNRKLTYDKYNRVASISEGGKVLETNYYNYDGLRREKDSLGKVVKYIYDGTNVVLELDDKGNISVRNVYGTKLISREAGGKKGYYRYNGHGDVVQIFAEDGTILASYYYDAFGNIKEETGSFDNPFKYCGYIYDKEADYYYMQSRMYDPVEGRFIQEDTYTGNPQDPLSLNLYIYCDENPMTYDDQNGHWPGWISRAWSGVKSVASHVWSGVKSAASWAWNGIKSVASHVWNGVKSVASHIWHGVTSVSRQVYSYARNTISRAREAVRAQVANLQAVRRAVEAARRKAQMIYDWGQRKAREAIDAVKKINLGEVISAASSIGSSVGIVKLGIAACAVSPLLGAGIICIGAIGAIHGAGQLTEGLTGVDPIRNVSRSLGISDSTYDKVADADDLMSTFVNPESGILKKSGKLFGIVSKGEKAINKVSEGEKWAADGKKLTKAASKTKISNWNAFEAANAGKYDNAGMSDAWKEYKDANGIVLGSARSQTAKSNYLKELKQSGKAPKWMNQWLSEGKVPPGYAVDHKVPLSIGGEDSPSNMRLLDVAFHKVHHSKGFYRPWQ